MKESFHIERLSALRAEGLKTELINLLGDTVNNGASVGFLRPLTPELADQFWAGVINAVSSQHKILLIARHGNDVVGTVQAELCPKQNGRHRAEIQKLMVLTTQRKRGIATKLMSAIERCTRDAGCSLLFLDTATGEPAEQLYLRLGWTRSGAIPNYALSPDGDMHSTTIFYKLFDTSSQVVA